jgi:hypothetical protein
MPPRPPIPSGSSRYNTPNCVDSLIKILSIASRQSDHSTVLSEGHSQKDISILAIESLGHGEEDSSSQVQERATEGEMARPPTTKRDVKTMNHDTELSLQGQGSAWRMNISMAVKIRLASSPPEEDAALRFRLLSMDQGADPIQFKPVE